MTIRSQLISALDSQQFDHLIEHLKLPEINQLLKTQDADDLIMTLAAIFNRCVDLMFSGTQQSMAGPDLTHFDEIIYECCRLLRNSCAINQRLQTQIVQFSLDGQCMFRPINLLLMSTAKVSSRTQKMCWQMVANLGVQNELTQREIWSKCIEPLIGQLNCVCYTGNDRECTMILYNSCISEILNANDVRRIVELLLECVCNHEYQHSLANNDFHRLFMEHLITKYRSIVQIYDRIVPHEKRLHLIYYIVDHMKIIRHEPVSIALLQFMCKEFKKKSDCVLRTTANSAIDTIYPKEVVALLDVIAQASSDERYAHVLATDNSLFINVGCLLRSIHDLGKRQTANGNDEENIFAPIQKLTQLAPNSNENTDIERDISYQLKSTLIRTLANLVYKNKQNQDLAREMEFIVAVLDSTTLDARNPLIKEWSILAIRNLCENNMENQQIISQLTKVGDSTSETVKEFNLDLGSLRINPNQS